MALQGCFFTPVGYDGAPDSVTATHSGPTITTSGSNDGMSEAGKATGDPTTTTSNMSATNPSTQGTDPSTNPSTQGTDGSTSTSEDATGGFSTPPDGGDGKQCDPWTQDCPPGEKCMPYSGDGDGHWESLKCTPVMENPGQAGYPCTVEGSGVSGIDSCDVGHMCWSVDSNTGLGSCVKFCTGSPEAPICTVQGTACTISNDGVLILCLPTCDPLLQDCAGGHVCIPDDGEFICVIDGSGGEGQEFDACLYLNTCDPGLYCVNSKLATECDPMASGCCLAFCDTAAPQCVGANAECLAWYEEGLAPSGLENVGICGLPQ